MLENLKTTNVHKDAIPYMIINDVIDVKEYDKLYEQWNNPDHVLWEIFLKKFNVKVVLQSKVQSIGPFGGEEKEYVGYWFFKQRNDHGSVLVKFKNIEIEYKSNCLLIVDSDQTFSVINKSNKGSMTPDMLNCVVYFDSNQQNKIKDIFFKS